MLSRILRHWLRLQGRFRHSHALVYGKVRAGADVGEGAWIPYGVCVEADCRIGRFSYIMPPGHLAGVSIGNFCSIAENCMFIRNQHPVTHFSTFPFARRLAMHGIDFEPLFNESIDRGDIVIEHDVWIGRNCTIMGGITIGTGAIIAAGAVVTHHVEPYTIVGGVPARPIRKRFSDPVIKRLLASRWWDWPLDEITARGKELEKILTDE